MKILSIPELNITDGKYHSVVVKREGNRASMQIDYEGFVEGTTGGVHKLLNMGGGSFFAGGLPNITEIRIVEAWVKSGGNAILQAADGSVVSSGMGAGASGLVSGSTFVGTMIQLGSSGEVRTQSVFSREKVTSYRVRTYKSFISRKIIVGRGGQVQSVVVQTSGGSVSGGSVSGGGGGSASGGSGSASGGGGSASGGGGTAVGGSGGSGAVGGIGGSGASGGIGLGIRKYGEGIPLVLGGQVGAGSSVGAAEGSDIQVIGDFGGKLFASLQ